ncbi:16S rRNA (guanine(527)-N(7))-methyltransferase RsmG [Candidatus Methylopumilus rimovensis]|jgi:16S rRNA (guanine527-N7)-methyltransferase|uniref:Ribosomal RNA small subunit methyltransferase G n=1 Tax=Candidatus Methylopumilus rimovensis TaxID=2588535 RepID=A0AAE6FTW0_9PROT|nr:16S rRNA (guanine(527)-N(7))-methyltransferase RsmG [Candidatus Methylopumilus rimovensis]QDD12805.1 16S rRNA (guanine(527)-N(7))-methyltransferase RsmG [Candidatus Methylopumilus rimovensis]QDD14105.1 16S rRNA (guanine(527)-N(7))-methyltransferase RsmG [Candidatus Methylopumilus rimovensis]
MNGTEKKDLDLLIEGLQRMALKLSDQMIDQLMTYLNLVEKWNRVYNLTAIRERDEMIKLHFLDSLSILNHVHVKNILDVGSGAGFPGIVLAITKPELKVTVMDSVNKKTTFMQQVKSELALTNLDVVNSRVEDYQPITLFEAVTSRAFSNLKNMMSLTQHTLQKEGVWLAMKSKDVKEELEEFEKNQYTLIPLEVPFINAERYLVILKKDNF